MLEVGAKLYEVEKGKLTLKAAEPPPNGAPIILQFITMKIDFEMFCAAVTDRNKALGLILQGFVRQLPK
ncbi:hypothetical protein [Geobacillus sp. Y412MC52]|uniref:hypothetical protein n=1 Tax=Geobacillus sp. (strain Y412MC52) TaxID=550542 RepID=UPI0002FF62F7|nr:hypothetical protein [Geobacillus sp. Y412MC52]